MRGKLFIIASIMLWKSGCGDGVASSETLELPSPRHMTLEVASCTGSSGSPDDYFSSAVDAEDKSSEDSASSAGAAGSLP